VILCSRQGPAALASVALLAVLAAIAAPASAQEEYEPTREQWVEQADAICKQPYQRGNRLVKRFEGEVEKRRLGRAGTFLIRISKIILKVHDGVAEVPRPPADEEAIGAYLNGQKKSGRRTRRAGKLLMQRKIRFAAKLLRKADRASTKGSKAVADFGLRHCL
jgi:hypothetical protein